MTPLMVLIATAAIGIEVGWEPLPEGGHEYTIQIEPTMVRTLEHSDITSDVPSQLHVRRYRITLGTGKLAQIDGEPAQPFDPPRKHPTLATEGDAPPEQGSPHLAEQPPAETFDNTFSSLPPPPSSDADTSEGHADMPAKFSSHPKNPRKLGAEKASFDDAAQENNANKPQLPPDTSRPWLPFLIAAVLLSCSLGANIYLGWIAWDARSRYRDVVAKYRPAAA